MAETIDEGVCPVCGKDALALVEPGETVNTPPRMDDSWRLCASTDGTYIHADLANPDWSPAEVHRRAGRGHDWSEDAERAGESRARVRDGVRDWRRL
jgi:hypothetical protein